MTNKATFRDLPTGYEPFNRRVYALAKKPFAWLWMLVAPWACALPFAMVASAAVNIASTAGRALSFEALALQVLGVGLVWTLYLGGLFFVIKLLRWDFR